MTATATDITREHYQRPEVKSVILRYCQDGEAFRALNGDQGWYTSANDGKVRLRTPGDYEDTITRFRTLYATLDLLDPSVKQASGVWDDTKHAPTEPIGTLRDCVAYTLGVDIDGVGDIQDPEVKGAVEDAARFLVDALNTAEITKSVHCLYSGGGIYVLIHHDLFRASPEWSPEDRDQAFRSLTMAFNGLIGEISRTFFEAHPEHSGKAKFDALNNQKRKFKTIFSIHKRLPFAVIPLDPRHIEINFDKARPPLSAEVLGEGERWYQSYDAEELPKLQELLKQFMKQAEEELKQRQARTGSYEISRRTEPLPIESWPPCMRNVLEMVEQGKGPHRALAVLASFLYQVGWAEDEAFKRWKPLAGKVDVETRIFDCWYGQMSCPNCSTIQKASSGYPTTGLGGLGYCQPDQHCKGCVWPGDYPLQKLIKESRSSTIPSFRFVSIADPKGSIGVCLKTGAVKRVVEIEDEDGPPKKFLAWVSDCPVNIHTETRAKDETEFTFEGTGAVDKRQVKFTMPATDLAEPRKFKAALLNAFGAKNKLGTISFEMVQEMTQNTRVMKRIEVPTWDSNIPLLPGVGLAGDVEYRLSSKIPATVYDGDLGRAKKILQKLLKVHKFAPLLVASILGAPAIARWHKNDRFGLGLWGSTGTLKTTTALTAMGFYGIGYVDGPKLKAGKAGSTTVGGLEVFAAAGFLPQIYDDVKTVDAKDAQNYVATMHGVLEGEEKTRGKRDGGLRESREFACIPIVTGEVRPQEASTSARVFNLNWTRADEKLLSEVQTNAVLLPVIGYRWLRFLASTDFVLGKDFEPYRSKKMEEFLELKYVNPGRLATIYALLVSVWDLLEASPIGDVFLEAHESFVAALNEAIKVQGMAVTEETEIERFLSGLEELLVANPGLVMSEEGKKVILGSIIGKRTDRGLFLLPTQTLNELAKIKTFTQQPTIDSITQGLNEKGILIRGEQNRLKTRMRVGEDRVYGWHITWTSVIEDLSLPTGDSKNSYEQAEKSPVPIVPIVPRENERKIFEKISEENMETLGVEKQNQENDGDSGDSGDKIDKINNNDTNDSDFIVPEVSSVVSSPTKTTGTTSIKEQREAAECEAQKREEHFRAKAEQHRVPKLNLVYQPDGAALEYAELACNPWIGCTHGCLYCYSPAQFHKTRDDYLIPELKNIVLTKLDADLIKLRLTSSKTKRKEPIHLMFWGDLYAPPNGDLTLPRRVLELFRKHDHPFQVLTKGGLKAVQDFELYGPDDRFGVTLTFLDPAKSRRWEPGAALPEERIAALKAAKEKGIKTWASCEPVIEPEETLAVIKVAAPYVDFFWVGKWNHDERANAIDWLKFKRDAITLLESLGKPYGIKKI